MQSRYGCSFSKKFELSCCFFYLVESVFLGYQWFDTAFLKLNTDAGISLLKEKYTIRAIDESEEEEKKEESDDEDEIHYIKKVDRKNDLALQFGCGLDWHPSESISYSLNMTYTPSINDLSDYFLTADTELRAVLNKRLFGSLKVIFDYDSTPGEGTASTETKYIMELGLRF